MKIRFWFFWVRIGTRVYSEPARFIRPSEAKKITENARMPRASFINLLNLVAKCTVNIAVSAAPQCPTSTVFVRYYMKQISRWYVCRYGLRGVMVNFFASHADDRGFEPSRAPNFAFWKYSAPSAIHNKSDFIRFFFAVLRFCIIVPHKSFQTVMVPVPRQNLEICSASICNTRQKERKLG